MDVDLAGRAVNFFNLKGDCEEFDVVKAQGFASLQQELEPVATAIRGLLRLGIWSFQLNGNGALGYFIHLFVERWVTWRIITRADFVCLGLSLGSPKTTFPSTVALTADCLIVLCTSFGF